MPGLGFNLPPNTAALSLGGYGVNYNKPKQQAPATTTAENFKNYSAVPQATATPTGVQNQINYLQNIPTGLTPEQELAMRNRIRSTDTAQQQGALNKVRELMASQGLGGSGAEASRFADVIRGQNATRQGALSNLDIQNAQMNLANQYNKAGLMNNMTGLGEQARQFDLGQAANMYQYGTSFDEDQRRYNQQRSDYYTQLNDWLNNYLNGGGYGSSGSFTANRSRS